jgi:hypothetical protein
MIQPSQECVTRQHREVYISPPSNKDWGKDIMGTGALAQGEGVKINFPHGNGACNFDIKVKYNDGDTAEWGGVDLCQYESVNLFWDKAAQQTRAVGE